MSKRHLVITADDFGYGSVRDQGIVDCYKAGAITRASTLVNGVNAQDAVRMAKAVGMPIIVHLNLTEGRPISEEATVDTLLNKTGFFLGKHGFREVLKAGHIDLKQVDIELRAQLSRFRDLVGNFPLAADGHQHFHVLPGVAQVVASVLSDIGVPWTRLPLEDTTSAVWVEEARGSFFKEVFCDSLVAKDVFAAKNVRTTEDFIGLATMGSYMTIERLQHAIIKDNGPSIAQGQHSTSGDVIKTCELMVHPGYPCPSDSGGVGEGPDMFSQSADRQHEMEILMSKEMASFYVKNNIELTAYPKY